MAITYLISKADFAPYVDVATNLDETRKLKPRIYEAQEFDLMPLMGEDFFSAYDSATFPNIADSITACLVYFTAARLVRRLDLHITPNAIMAKRNDFSDPVDYKLLNATCTEFENLAIAWWGKAQKIIIAGGKDVYPLYQGFKSCGNDNSNGFRPRIYGIKGRDTNGWR